ncbi:unnamed protein product [Caenorhabditis auriculariae]|uniref:Uncharacterized protein n=1 Tax=Caenorhabditis auriculariae TaxID=2777116 RepID=A0A8S1HT69_9PELO|nr:unnamed protein product [Caenorhabditis auriculariae]
MNAFALCKWSKGKTTSGRHSKRPAWSFFFTCEVPVSFLETLLSPTVMAQATHSRELDTNIEHASDHKALLDGMKTPRSRLGVVSNSIRTPGGRNLLSLNLGSTKKPSVEKSFAVFNDHDGSNNFDLNEPPKLKNFCIEEADDEGDEDYPPIETCSTYVSDKEQKALEMKECFSELFERCDVVLTDSPAQKASLKASQGDVETILEEAQILSDEDYPPVELASTKELDKDADLHEIIREMLESAEDVVLIDDYPPVHFEPYVPNPKFAADRARWQKQTPQEAFEEMMALIDSIGQSDDEDDDEEIEAY